MNETIRKFTPDEAYEKAQQEIRLCIEEGKSTLNFCGLNLERIPPEIMNVTTLTSLSLYGCEIDDFSPIENLKGIRVLEVGSSRYKFPGLGFAKEWTDLKSLDLLSTEDLDIKHIQKNTNLESLHLNGRGGGIQLLNFNVIAKFQKLKTLFMSEINMPSLEAIGSLKSLTYVSISDGDLSSLAGFDTLDKVEVLSLWNTKVSDLSPIQDYVNLKKLNLNGTKVEDLSPLVDLFYLEELNLKGTSIRDISALGTLGENCKAINDEIIKSKERSIPQSSGLKVLNLSETDVSDLRPLATSRGLRRLYASNTKIEEIYVCSKLPWLMTLEINNTDVTTLGAKKSLARISFLSASHTKILDLEALSGADGLQALSIENTAVSDISWIRNAKACNSLKLRYSNVQDMEPLSTIGGYFPDRAGSFELDFRNTPASRSSKMMEKLADLAEDSLNDCFEETKAYLNDKKREIPLMRKLRMKTRLRSKN